MTDVQITVAPFKSFVKTTPPDAVKVMSLFLMFVATLYFGKEVLVPITLAFLLAFILAPLVDLLTHLRIGRVPAVLLGVAVALTIVAALGSVIGAQISDLTTDLPEYATTVEAKISVVKNHTTDRLSHWAEKIGAQDSKGATSSDARRQGRAQAAKASPVEPTPPAAAPEMTPLNLTERYLSSVLSPLATFGIVFVVAVFALLQREDLRNRLIRLIGSADLHQTTVAIDDGGRRLSRYFITQLTINAIYGIVVGVGLLVIGVPNPILWAILSSLLRFVPYVGPVISAVLPMTLAAAVAPGWAMTLWTGALFLVVELLTGQIVEPLIYGNSTGLSPFSVVVAAIFWSWVWGPIGLILSTPLTLCLVVIGRHVKRLEFLDVMLGDRAPLTPVEIFYQRLLAGDPDEAQDQAERVLKEVSLSTYYDEVALQGLRRATEDARRNAIDRDQLDCIRSAIGTLVIGLEAHSDEQPETAELLGEAILGDEEPSVRRHPDPESISQETDDLTDEWRHRPAVLCIAGRGPLDEAATAMLVQLLGKHGMSARLVRYEEVSRERIDSFDATGVAMACICCLEIDGSSAALRYLIQRLRNRLSIRTPVVVGLWPTDRSEWKSEDFRSAIRADFYTSSFEQTVTTCAETALAEGKAAEGELVSAA
jgi:predicted PurR-regulated permease PerM